MIANRWAWRIGNGAFVVQLIVVALLPYQAYPAELLRLPACIALMLVNFIGLWANLRPAIRVSLRVAA